MGLSKTGGKNANKSKPMNVGEHNKNSSASSVQEEMKRLKAEGKSKSEHFKNLKGLLKVIKRGSNPVIFFIPDYLDVQQTYCNLNPYASGCVPIPNCPDA
jgi:hypothetical protein